VVAIFTHTQPFFVRWYLSSFFPFMREVWGWLCTSPDVVIQTCKSELVIGKKRKPCRLAARCRALGLRHGSISV
jgi:hypothetical protein